MAYRDNEKKMTRLQKEAVAASSKWKSEVEKEVSNKKKLYGAVYGTDSNTSVPAKKEMRPSEIVAPVKRPSQNSLKK